MDALDDVVFVESRVAVCDMIVTLLILIRN